MLLIRTTDRFNQINQNKTTLKEEKMAIRRMSIIGLVAIMMLIAGAGGPWNAVAQEVEGETALVGHFGESWTGSSANPGLSITNTGTGYGFYGKGSFGVWGESALSNKAGIYGKNTAVNGWGVRGVSTKNGGYGVYGTDLGNGVGVYGTATTGTGVLGSSDDGDGVWGGTNDATNAGVYALNGGTGPGVDAMAGGIGVNALSFQNDGVVGTSWSDGKSGVRGEATLQASYGVSGYSGSEFGVFAHGPDEWGDAAGDLFLDGTLGEIVTWANVLYEGSHNNIIMDLDNNNDNAGACLYIRDGEDNNVTSFCETTNNASTIITAGSQASVVQTQNEGQRLMYAVEGTGVWVEDVGTATLVNGELTIAFKPAYAQAASLSGDYQVFATAKCDQPVLLYVSSQTVTDFTVKGTNLDGSASNCAFNYRVVAPRAGYESVWMEQYTPADVAQQP
jgi:hypothetical protein